MARLDVNGSGRNRDPPWALVAPFGALVALGRLIEAKALLPKLFAAGRRFSTPVVTPLLCGLAAAEQRFDAAALLLGYAQQSYDSRALTFERQEAARPRARAGGRVGSTGRPAGSGAGAAGPSARQRRGRGADGRQRAASFPRNLMA